ncbi:MAG: hypothetical protein ACFFA3_16785 [Promethearchaeota archaeon]
MAYMIPIIANRKNYRRSSPGAVIAGLIIFLVFGILFFLFLNRSWVFGFNFSIVFWIGGFMIFFAIILAITAAISASSVSKNIKPRNGDPPKQQIILQKPVSQINPYKSSNIEKINLKTPENNLLTEIINYCSFCGAKKELDAIYCHMCGSKF